MGGWDRYHLSSWNAMTHSSDHSNSFHLCSRRKKCLHLSADLDINRFRAAIIPVNFCTSLGFRGGYQLLMALIWSGFTSISLLVTISPRNFPKPTQKEHLDAFKCSLCFLRISKILVRSVKYSDTNLLFTTMSSIYTSTFLPSYSSNILVIIR